MISVENLHFSYLKSGGESQKVIEGVSLEIQNGQRVALMGANGCGKSTLLKLIAGLLLPEKGKIVVDGLTTPDQAFKTGMGRKIGIVFQNPDNQLFSVTAEREIAVGLENHSYDKDIIKARVDKALKDAGIEWLRHKQISKLSGGEKQMISLLSVLVLEPNILLLDEPFSHLDLESRNFFSKHLQKMIEERNIMVVMATQDFADTLTMDRLILMKNGKIEFEGDPATFINSPKKLISVGIAPPVKPLLKSVDRQILENPQTGNQSDEKERSSKAFVSVRNLNFSWKGDSRGDLISNLNLELYEGHVSGIAGPNGCGKSTLALILAGLVKPDSGKIIFNSNPVHSKDLLRSVIYIFQSPERGLFAGTVYEDIAFGPRNMGYSESEIDNAVKRNMIMAGLDFELFMNREPFELSAGEQRLAAIAGALATGKKVVILDEPVEELDFYGRQRVKAIIEDLRKNGHAVCVISHDSDFLFAVCDEIGFLQKGGLTVFEKSDLYGNPGYFTEASARVPAIIRAAAEMGLADVFRVKGIDLLEFLLHHPDLTGE